MNVAVTLRACVILTVHVLVPLHPSPLQPVNVEPLFAVAVSVTLVPKSKRRTACAATGNTRWATRHCATARPCFHHR